MAQTVKNPSAVLETWVQSAMPKIPWRREWLPTPVFWPGEFREQRSLVGYSPWGQKESDTTERLSRLLLLLPRNNDTTMTWKLKSLLKETSLAACWCDGGSSPVVTDWQPRGARIGPRLSFPSSGSL